MGLIKIGQAAKLVGRTPRTIKNWYNWAEETGNLNLLPELVTNLDAKGTRYLEEHDIQKLIDFKDSMKYGDRAEFHAKLWGKRGEEITKKKEELT